MNAAPVAEVDADLADLIPQYLSHRWADLGLGRELLANAEYERLARMAHRIYGTAASYGFAGLGDVVRDLEAAAQRGDQEAINTALERYDAFLRSVRIEYV
jgi:HPt (histidine-containing phosphotransfer) domain-containing protein